MARGGQSGWSRQCWLTPGAAVVAQDRGGSGAGKVARRYLRQRPGLAAEWRTCDLPRFHMHSSAHELRAVVVKCYRCNYRYPVALSVAEPETRLL
jgi:hypothetical protein